MHSLALVTAATALEHDKDMPLLVAACEKAGLKPDVVAWDAAGIDWTSFDAIVLRSPWDYTERLPEFLAWCEQASAQVRLLNPLPVLRWNVDKHYLQQLQHAGIAIVPTRFVKPGEDALAALRDVLATQDSSAIVVKPVISAGARDTRRHPRDAIETAAAHLQALLHEGRYAMLQPYLQRIDRGGETALLYFDGRFCHAIRKGALLDPAQPGLEHPNASGDIRPRSPQADELALGDAVLTAVTHILRLEQPLLYARIDLIRDDAGKPCLLELELTEPSLFLDCAPNAAAQFVACLQRRLSTTQASARIT